MIKRYCDKCGCELNEVADRFLTASTRTRVDTYDLCEECFSGVIVYIKGEAPSEENGTEEVNGAETNQNKADE